MSRFPSSWRCALGALLACLLAAHALAGDEPAAAPDARAAERAAAVKAAKDALVRGPSHVTLRDQAVLELPEGYGFVPPREGAELMRTMGNREDEGFLGLIYPLRAEAAGWFVDVSYRAAGYVKDDDAAHWDAKQLLDSLKEGTEAANEERTRAGIPPIEVTRWIEPPAYDKATHRLVWSAEAKLKDRPDPDPTVNYNTYLLGREGYVSLNLITSAAAVEANKEDARTLLAAVDFNAGKRYGDFNASTDKIAAYGLGALIAGVAAKKLGLLALAGAAILKFSKVIIVAVVAFGAGIRRWVKSKFGKAEDAAA